MITIKENVYGWAVVATLFIGPGVMDAMLDWWLL